MKMSITCLTTGDVYEGQHVHTIPGHRKPTKEEIAKYFKVTPESDAKKYKRLNIIAGVHRYVLLINGQYIICPINEHFKVKLL